MSGMYLLPAMYSTTGKPRGKRRWASADAKRKAEALKSQWERTLAEIDKLSPKTKTKNVNAIPAYSKIVPPGRETPHFESKDTGWITCVPVKDKEYTGDKILGIGTLHKSNGVPVFSDQEAKDISSMRR